MTRRKRVESRIPDDWQPEDGYTFWVLCAPKSEQWSTVIRTAIFILTRGRYWDADTGSILETQAIAREIESSLMQCDDLVANLELIAQELAQLASINASLQGMLEAMEAIQGAISGIEQANVEISVSATSRNTLLAEANASASTSSFAEALAYAGASAVSWPATMPPNITPPLIEGGTPPQPGDDTEYGFTDTPVPFNDTSDPGDISCQVAWELVEAVRVFLEVGLSFFRTTTTLVPFTAAMQLVASAAEWMEREEALPFILPRPIAAALAASLAGVALTDDVELHLEGMVEFVQDNHDDLRDIIYCVRVLGNSAVAGVKDIAEYVAGAGELTLVQKAQLGMLFSVVHVSGVVFDMVDYPLPTVNTQDCTSCGQ